VRILDFRRDLFDPHHRRAHFSELGFLAGLRIELRQIGDRGAQIFRLAGGGIHPGPMTREFALGVAPSPPGSRRPPRFADMAAERIQQIAMRAGIDQRALVMLSVDLDQRAADIAHQRHARRLIVDEHAGAPVRSLYAAENDVAIVVQRILGENRTRRMVTRHVEHGCHLPLRRAMANERCVAARAKRQRERVEQDGFSGACLARQHGEAGRKVDVQPLDQDDIADRKSRQHP
jgi:hypothetical protein